jgi:hypothetical protein
MFLRLLVTVLEAERQRAPPADPTDLRSFDVVADAILDRLPPRVSLPPFSGQSDHAPVFRNSLLRVCGCLWKEK